MSSPATLAADRLPKTPPTHLSARNPVRQDQHRGSKVQKSQSKIFDDIDAFRRNFAEVRKAFLRENYRNPEQVAVVYGVRFQSALNWWNGNNAGSGAFVAEDFRLHPESAAHHYCRGRAA
jgi:hypothetical protein